MTNEPPQGAARLVPLMLDGPAGPLEALLQEREGEAHEAIAVVCHPHPLYGGTLHNKVAHRVASALFALGAAVIRFNFRGVGKSAGTFDRGVGELEDARCAFRYLAARHPGSRRWAAGFSFGSWVASRLAASEPSIERLLLIAPPVHTQTFEEMRTLTIPKVIVQGLGDEICRPENLVRALPAWAGPKRLIEVPEASHFFDKQLAELAQAVQAGMAERMPD
jgi:alpha/beta superfamily hydrolase